MFQLRVISNPTMSVRFIVAGSARLPCRVTDDADACRCPSSQPSSSSWLAKVSGGISGGWPLATGLSCTGPTRVLRRVTATMLIVSQDRNEPASENLITSSATPPSLSTSAVGSLANCSSTARPCWKRRGTACWSTSRCLMTFA